MRTLAEFVEQKRREAGLSQGELAARADIPRTTINRIENGHTKLPEAGIRRRLARVLGVSHLDLLVAAGEITEEEIDATGAVPVVELDPTTPMARLAPLISQVPWNDERLEFVESDLRFYIEFDARKC